MHKIGIIGAGFIGEIHAAAIADIEGAKLAAVCDADAARAEKLAEKFGCKSCSDIDDILNAPEIDVVSICLPTFLHEEACLAAFAAGKHVLCEKPFTLSLASGERIAAASEAAGKKLMVGQVLRFWPEYAAIRRLLLDGSLGEVDMGQAARLSQRPWSPWFFDPAKSGGALYDLHIHDVDILYHLLGPVDSVYARGRRNAQGAWTYVETCMNFRSGASAAPVGTNDLPDGYPFTMQMRLSGDRGTVDFSMRSDDNVRGRDTAAKWLTLFPEEGAPREIEAPAEDAYRNEWVYFLDCLDGREDGSLLPPEDSLALLKIVAAIERSLETGEVVRVL